MSSPRRLSPHSVKRWHLESVGLRGGEIQTSMKDNIHFDQTVSTQTRFSAWTPVASKSFNKQVNMLDLKLLAHKGH